MVELITNLILIIIIILVGFVVVYSLVRLAAIAFYRTKREFDTLSYTDEEYPERKHQNDEEL